MSISRKELIERLKAKISEFDSYLNEPPTYEDKLMVREYRHEAYRKWDALSLVLLDVVAALSVAPAPEAAEPISKEELKAELEEFAETFSHRLWTACEDAWNAGNTGGEHADEHEALNAEIAEASRVGLEGYVREFIADLCVLVATPPVQEGPKGVELHLPADVAQAIPEDLPWDRLVAVSNVPIVHEAIQNFSDDSTEDNAVCMIREILKGVCVVAHQDWICPQCLKPKWAELIGVTLNDGTRVCSARCERAFLSAVPEPLCASPAQSIPAAIDEEGREAISAAILSLEEQKIVLGMYRSIPETVNSATNGRAAIERHIAALERLLADPDPSRTQG